MRRVLIVIAFVIVAVFTVRYFYRSDNSSIEYNTNLIQQQINNVGKLIVTEGHFSEVLTYRDTKGYILNMLTSEKKALIIVNAEVTVAYDLRQVTYDIDKENKVITIKDIPKEEIKIHPDIKFYSIEHGTLNPFTGDDYNKINKTVRENLKKKIAASTLKTNAQNRLISELSKILILTNSLGWTLEYRGETIQNEQDFNLKL